MYYEHFGLTQAPFKITPNTEFFFSGGNRGPVLEALIYAITRGEGIVKVTGEVGSGKTMLCNMLQSRLPELVESVYLANPSVSPEDVLHAIAFELQLGLDRRADRLEVLHALQDYLVKRHAEGKRVVVFSEESQSMPLATLEEIRLLSNLETRNDKLLQIVLFGQPELDTNLRRPDIRQLRDRIAHSFRLQPLTDEDVREYLMFRMRAAGYRGPEIFSPQVVKQIARASSGLTRRINLIADKALLAAFAEDTHTIQPRHVRAALRDSEFGQERPRWRFSPAWGWAAATLVIGTALGAVLHATFERSANAAPAASLQAAPPAAAQEAAAARTALEPAQGNLEVRPVSGPAVATVVARSAGSEGPGAAPAAATGVARVTVPAASGPSPGSSPAPAQTTPATVAVAAPAVSPAAQSGKAAREVGAHPAPVDFIEARMAATDRWLASADPAGYSIQLMVSENERQLRKHLKGLPKSIETNELYMYRSAVYGRPSVNVLLGSYPDRETALDVISGLPASLRFNRPYVRTLSGIRTEVEQQRQR